MHKKGTQSYHFDSPWHLCRAPSFVTFKIRFPILSPSKELNVWFFGSRNDRKSDSIFRWIWTKKNWFLMALGSTWKNGNFVFSIWNPHEETFYKLVNLCFCMRISEEVILFFPKSCAFFLCFDHERSCQPSEHFRAKKPNILWKSSTSNPLQISKYKIFGRFLIFVALFLGQTFSAAC